MIRNRLRQWTALRVLPSRCCARWQNPSRAAVGGEIGIRLAFKEAFAMLEVRIRPSLALSLEPLSDLALSPNNLKPTRGDG